MGGRDFRLQYLRQSTTRVGGKYKKAVYTLYSNESFTERLESKQRKNELGILGPVIRAQIRDVIKVRSHSIKNKSRIGENNTHHDTWVMIRLCHDRIQCDMSHSVIFHILH